METTEYKLNGSWRNIQLKRLKDELQYILEHKTGYDTITQFRFVKTDGGYSHDYNKVSCAYKLEYYFNGHKKRSKYFKFKILDFKSYCIEDYYECCFKFNAKNEMLAATKDIREYMKTIDDVIEYNTKLIEQFEYGVKPDKIINV